MVKPTPKERVEHILEAIRLIKEFVAGMDEVEFLADIKIQSAVQFQFLIISEAIRHIDDHILAKYNYPWHVPRSFRNFIIHVYHGIRMERIYYAAKDLKELEKQVQLILKNEFK
jgi:uncharacterized protein with HEPN domain